MNHRRYPVVFTSGVITLIVVSSSAAAWFHSWKSSAVISAQFPRDSSGARLRHFKPGWPRLFGPHGDSTSDETGLCFDWPKSGPPVKWRLPVGEGYSSPVTLGDRLVVFHRVDSTHVVDCLNPETGASIWRHTYDTDFAPPYPGHGRGPICTPALEADASGARCYVYGTEGVLSCLNLADGSLVWKRGLAEEYEAPLGIWGVGASPLVEGELVIVNLGAGESHAGVIALDKHTGEVIWTATDHGASYATPVAATIHHQRRLFVFTDRGLVHLDPLTGRVDWFLPFAVKGVDQVNATTPLVHGDLVLLVAGPGPGALCVRVLENGGYREVWSDRKALDSQFNNLVCHERFVYGYTSKWVRGASFRCVDLLTGEIQWEWSSRDSQLQRGSTVAVDGKLILWGENGHLACADLSPAGLRVHARSEAPLLDSPTMSAPALHRGLLYLRNQNEIACFNLREK